MNTNETYQLTKTDFLTYLDCPLHLWAQVHGHIISETSPMAEGLIRQGYEVEQLAVQYLQAYALTDGGQLITQKTFKTGHFSARVDALVFNPESNAYDLYEIKSSTSIDKQNIWDCTFQYMILKPQMKLSHVYLLHLNKEYVLTDQLDMAQLFVAEDITLRVKELLPLAENERHQALLTAIKPSTDDIEHCYNPKSCPCPHLCHPDLPEFSIYDIAYLTKTKKQDLENLGVRSAADVPDDFELNFAQKRLVQLAVQGKPLVDYTGIRLELHKLEFPLYLLDYETFTSAVPLYPGYRPQERMVFQYSLHNLSGIGGSLSHFEYLSTGLGDPSLGLLAQLSQVLGSTGAILVWNKSFEMSCNTLMARIHPQFADFLKDLNSRIYDLADFIRNGLYLHPGFKGSWSIKNVLPVMVPELSYEVMAIQEGGQASETWWQMVYGNMPLDEKVRTRQALLDYCELDSLAMVRIYEELYKLSHPER